MTTPSNRINPLLVGIAAVAALAGLLFGFDVGVISGAIVFIKKIYALSAAEEGLIVSATPFGALIAAVFCGKFNDILGRRNNLIITALLFFVGTMGCVFANSPDRLVVARLVIGLAIGVGSFSAPLYISEIAGQRHRGALVTLNQLAIVSGILLAYLVDYFFSNNEGWRYMFASGLVPAVLLLVLASFLPESPRWLVSHRKEEKAHAILTRIHGVEAAKQEINELRHLLRSEQKDQKGRFPKGFLKVLTLGILVSILTQAVGINAIIYYAPTIFQSAGLGTSTSAIFATIGVGLVNLIFTGFAIRLLDKYGRRPLLITGIRGITLSLVVMVTSFALGFAAFSNTVVAILFVIIFALIILQIRFAFKQIPFWVYILIAVILFACYSMHAEAAGAKLVFFSALFFVACQAFSTGPACWLIPSEIFPVRMRGLGMGLSVAFNWGTNVVIAALFPVILSKFGGTVAFMCFLVIAVIALVYFTRYVPETKNVSLEQIEANLYAGKKTRDLGD